MDEGKLLAAVKSLLRERNTVFDDLLKKMDQFPEMERLLKLLLYAGKTISFKTSNKAIEIANMFNFVVNVNDCVKVSNRVFEIYLYDKFATDASLSDSLYNEGAIEKNSFIKAGHLDMRHILERFVVHYNDIYGNMDDKFHEKEGRKYFMFYLKPIINGTGNYYVEAETRDETRTDLIVDYLGEQFVIELKIWRGSAYNQRGEEQLKEYLDYYHVDKGYMLSFCFNKNKIIGVHEVEIGNKILVEAIV